MKKVTRDPKTLRLLFTGNLVWDKALTNFITHFPRLLGHISRVDVGGPATRIFLPPTPEENPFGILTLKGDVKDHLEAVEDLASTLVLLARYLRYHARTETPNLPPPLTADSWTPPTVH